MPAAREAAAEAGARPARGRSAPSGPPGWQAALALLAALLPLIAPAPARAGSVPEPAPVPQLPRDGWKDCAFNDVTLPCIDRQRPDGLEIVWKDGPRMTYTLLPGRGDGGDGRPARLRDRLGGIWEREVLIQGNTVLTNTANGNRIVVPLRFPCRPPLRGEVGTCRR